MKMCYSSEELQELFKCSRQTICRMESDGRLKRLYGLPGTFYRAADVLPFVNTKIQHTGRWNGKGSRAKIRPCPKRTEP